MASAVHGVWAIDMGSSALKALQMRQGDEGLEVIDFAYLEYSRNLSSGDLSTDEKEQIIAETLQEYKIVMLRGHGSFATGQTLDEAFQWTSALEECCQIIVAAKLIDEPFIEYRKMSADYGRW